MQHVYHECVEKHCHPDSKDLWIHVDQISIESNWYLIDVDLRVFVIKAVLEQDLTAVYKPLFKIGWYRW